MQPYVLSRNVRTIHRHDGRAVYHSLFGGLAILDDGAYALLERFKVPTHLPLNADNVVGIIDAFRERSFIVPVDLDDRTIIEDELEARMARCHTGYLVRALQLVVTNECNFRCKYCFVKSMWNSPERTALQVDPSNRMMSPATARLAVDETLALLREHKHDVLHIEFFGGEPLANWSLIETVLNEYGNGAEGDVALRYSITTNGSLITEEIAQVLQRFGVTVTLSFDSPASTDRVLPHAGRRTARELLDNKLRLLRGANNYVTFNSVLSKDSVTDFNGHDLVDYALNNGVRMIGLILDLDLDFYAHEGLKKLAADKLISTYLYGLSRGLPIVGYWHQTFAQMIGRQYINLASGYKTCPAEGCKLSVEPGGGLFICKCCAQQLGHISALRDALATPAYSAYAKKGFQNAPACAGCDIEGFCSGVCMGAIEKRYGQLGLIEPSACDLFREITHRLVTDSPFALFTRITAMDSCSAGIAG